MSSITVEPGAILAAALFASTSKRDKRTVLTGVRFEWAGREARICATDSYRAARLETVHAIAEGEGAFTVPAEALKQLVKASRGLVTLQGADGGRVEISQAGTASTVEGIEGAYPDISKLWKADEWAPSAHSAANAAFIADACKAAQLASGVKNHEIKIDMHEDLRPICITAPACKRWDLQMLVVPVKESY